MCAHLKPVPEQGKGWGVNRWQWGAEGGPGEKHACSTVWAPEKFCHSCHSLQKPLNQAHPPPCVHLDPCRRPTAPWAAPVSLHTHAHTHTYWPHPHTSHTRSCLSLPPGRLPPPVECQSTWSLPQPAGSSSGAGRLSAPCSHHSAVGRTSWLAGICWIRPPHATAVLSVSQPGSVSISHRADHTIYLRCECETGAAVDQNILLKMLIGSFWSRNAFFWF